MSFALTHRARAAYPPHIRIAQADIGRIRVPDTGNNSATFWTRAFARNVVLRQHIHKAFDQEFATLWAIAILPRAHTSGNISRVHVTQACLAPDFARANQIAHAGIVLVE